MSKNFTVKIKSDDGEKEFNLVAGEYTLGRSRKADIAISDKSLSRKHLNLIVTNDSLSVCDLGTTNVTFLNGSKI